jgi:phage gpG-like protein
MGVEKFGDWGKVEKLLTGNLASRFQVAVYKATVKNALLLVREIKRGIKRQAPGDQPFVKLAESTIKKKGSSKALIDTGFLVNSITQKIMGDRAFIGVLRTARNTSGDEIANIGAIMEFGATINHPNGGVIIIPPRPFMHPVMKKYQKQVLKNYEEAVKSVFG